MTSYGGNLKSWKLLDEQFRDLETGAPMELVVTPPEGDAVSTLGIEFGKHIPEFAEWSPDRKSDQEIHYSWEGKIHQGDQRVCVRPLRIFGDRARSRDFHRWFYNKGASGDLAGSIPRPQTRYVLKDGANWKVAGRACATPAAIWNSAQQRSWSPNHYRFAAQSNSLGLLRAICLPRPRRGAQRSSFWDASRLPMLQG